MVLPLVHLLLPLYGITLNFDALIRISHISDRWTKTASSHPMCFIRTSDSFDLNNFGEEERKSLTEAADLATNTWSDLPVSGMNGSQFNLINQVGLAY